MSFEREDLITGACYNHIILQEPAIEPQVDGHEPVWVFSELAKRVGLGDYFTMSIPEYIDIRLQTQYPLIAGVQPPVTYERLKAEKMIRAAAPPEPKYTPYLNPAEVLDNETGRMEIMYSEKLAELDMATTKVLEPNKIGKSTEYPYQLFTGRQRFFMQSSFTDDPITVKLSGETPATRLNPVQAQRLGLAEGDMVEVFNERGHVVTRLVLDESVPDGTVHVWFGLASPPVRGGHLRRDHAPVRRQGFAGPARGQVVCRLACRRSSSQPVRRVDEFAHGLDRLLLGFVVRHPQVRG